MVANEAPGGHGGYVRTRVIYQPDGAAVDHTLFWKKIGKKYYA